VGAELEEQKKLDYQKILLAIGTGVAVSVITQITLDWVRGTGGWKKSGSLRQRVKKESDAVKSSLFHLPSPLG
jgi:regulatory protein YycH of two-component signal transduction system YycFG